MTNVSPLKIIAIGFVLVLLGFVIPALMVLHIIEANFVLAFLSHGASVAGLLLGLVGTALYRYLDKSKRR
jgi:hypothetical protein